MSGFGMQDRLLPTIVTMTRVDQHVDSVRFTRQGKFTIEVVPPENAGYSIASQNERMAKHLVVHDLIYSHVAIFRSG